MRAPRYRFPDEVRSTTRDMAARMAEDGTAAQSPEELEAWVSREPEVQASLERGGYGREFTAGDLFPLLQVFIGKETGTAPQAAAPPRHAGNGRLVGFAVLALILVVLLWFALSSGGVAR